MRALRGAVLVVSMLLSLQVLAQEQVVRYYDLHWDEVDKANATYYGTEELIKAKPAVVKVSKYLIDTGAPSSVTYYHAKAYKKGQEVLQGESKLWYDNGHLAYKANYIKDKLNDSLISYYESGTVKRIEIYKNDVMLEGCVYAEDGTEVPYFPYEEMPVFPGGEQAMFDFMASNIIYPIEAIRAGISGTVQISFVIGRDGIIRDIEVTKGVRPILDEEAIRIIEAMPIWKPGRQDGRPVPVRYNMPVKFSFK